MPQQTIENVGGAWTTGAQWQTNVTPQNIEVVWYVNNSGATRTAGDVVVADYVAGLNANTTTTASDVTVVGVVTNRDPSQALVTAQTAAPADTYAAGAIMPVVIKGHARINIASNTVAAGANLATSTAVGVAAVPATAASVAALQALVGSFIAIAAEAQSAKDANNTIRCYIQKM